MHAVQKELEILTDWTEACAALWFFFLKKKTFYLPD